MNGCSISFTNYPNLCVMLTPKLFEMPQGQSRRSRLMIHQRRPAAPLNWPKSVNILGMDHYEIPWILMKFGVTNIQLYQTRNQRCAVSPPGCWHIAMLDSLKRYVWPCFKSEELGFSILFIPFHPKKNMISTLVGDWFPDLRATTPSYSMEVPLQRLTRAVSQPPVRPKPIERSAGANFWK